MKKFIFMHTVIMGIWACCIIFLHLQLIDWINFSFLCGLAATLFAVCIYIWKSKFLHLFTDGFRSLGSFFMPINRSRALHRANEQIKQDEKFQHFKELLAQRLFILLTSVASASILISISGIFLYY
ncbi:DUF3899 domain-containing protein [Virgibacillus halophilus]|uniref:DUF3899 domain-containing protein n=1 Tax=Tigheibacillus halophilus TaxID=361280 RepID=UPI00363E5F02